MESPNRLSAGDGTGTHTLTRTAYIAVQPYTLDFGAQPLTGTGPLSVSFTALTTVTFPVTAFLWDFGDGYTSTLTDPVHSYVPGVYTVILTGTSGLTQAVRVKEGYIRISAPDEVTVTYRYDALYRLVEANYTSGEQYGYGYDPVGNRLTQTVAGGRATEYGYDDANRLSEVDSQGYTWDDDGNLVSDGVFAYTYDGANRLVRATDGANTTDYVYDGDGNLRSRTVNGLETRYTLDVAASLEQVLVEDREGTTTTYLYGAGRVAYQESTTGWKYYLADGLGSVRQEVGESGEISTAYRFDPYGAPLQGSGGNPFGYTGEQWDASAGLLYLRARYYSPVLGRFVSRDPWPGYGAAPQSLNRYAYVINNPVNLTDPRGLWPILPPPWFTRALAAALQPFFDKRNNLNQEEKVQQALLLATQEALLSFDIPMKVDRDTNQCAELRDLALLQKKHHSDVDTMLAVIMRAAELSKDDPDAFMANVSSVLSGRMGGGLDPAIPDNIHIAGCRIYAPWPSYQDKDYYVQLLNTGFAPQYTDPEPKNPQVHHFWFYVQLGYYHDAVIGSVGNVLHETVLSTGFGGKSWEDFYLGQEGVKIGTLLRLGLISPSNAADMIAGSLKTDLKSQNKVIPPPVGP